MSRDDVFRLFESAVDDESLSHRLDDADRPEKVAAIGAEMGCQFTPRELQEVLEDMHSKVADELGEAELSEDELSKVAGGVATGELQRTPTPVVADLTAPAWTQGFFNDAILAERWLFIC